MSIEAAFTVTRDEYVRAMRRHYKTKLQVKRDLAGGLIAILGGVALLQFATTPILAWLLIVVGGVLLALLLYAMFLLPHLIYQSQPKLKSEYHLEFRDDGIGFRTDEIDSQLKWSLYHSWVRDDDFYVLYHGRRDVSVVPRRALPDAADDQLTELLRRKIGPAAAT